jgi:hypothetical protein
VKGNLAPGALGGARSPAPGVGDFASANTGAPTRPSGAGFSATKLLSTPALDAGGDLSTTATATATASVIAGFTTDEAGVTVGSCA